MSIFGVDESRDTHRLISGYKKLGFARFWKAFRCNGTRIILYLILQFVGCSYKLHHSHFFYAIPEAFIHLHTYILGLDDRYWDLLGTEHWRGWGAVG